MSDKKIHLVVVGVLSALFIGSLIFFGAMNYQSGMPLAMVLLNSLLLAIPLILLFFSIGLIVAAWQQHRQGGKSVRLVNLLYLTPRIAGILIALFTGLFALDVFEMEGSIWQKIGAFILHAAPAIVMIVVMVFAWRRAWIGALVFGLAALVFLRFVIGSGMMGFGNLLLFVLPMAVVAALFWLNWRWRGEIESIRLGNS